MAGSKSKKLRVQNDKFWAYLEILLHYCGLRVDIDKTGGLFRKRARPNRYLRLWAAGSGSNGSDLMASGSNLTRLFRIERLRSKATDGGGGTRRDSSAAAVPGWSSPDFTNCGVPGANSTGVWVRDGQRIMRDPPET